MDVEYRKEGDEGDRYLSPLRVHFIIEHENLVSDPSIYSSITNLLFGTPLPPILWFKLLSYQVQNIVYAKVTPSHYIKDSFLQILN